MGKQAAFARGAMPGEEERADEVRITVEPKKPGRASGGCPGARCASGSVLVEAIAVGVCGTDVEIVGGQVRLGAARQEALVLGHESLGRVIDPGPAGGLKKGDLVVGIVRRPDPVPCPNCAVGEWDMCRNGQYTERGIKQIDGFMSERWRIEPEYAMKVDPTLGLLGVLLEPTTVVTKAWEQVARGRPARVLGAPERARDRRRAHWPARGAPRRAARSGGPRPGPVDSGPKPDLVRALGATYHSRFVSVGFRAGRHHRMHRGRTGHRRIDQGRRRRRRRVPDRCRSAAAERGRRRRRRGRGVLKNNVVVGSVNANKRHWYKAAEALARADRAWLGVVTRRERPEDFAQALERKPDDIKVVIQFAQA